MSVCSMLGLRAFVSTAVKSSHISKSNRNQALGIIFGSKERSLLVPLQALFRKGSILLRQCLEPTRT